MHLMGTERRGEREQEGEGGREDGVNNYEQDESKTIFFFPRCLLD